MVIDDWHNCYKRRWNSYCLLTEAAYAHPAKVSFGLAERIYQHVIDEGWLRPGDTVLDCFGGIGGFAYHAMLHGLHFTGIELEPRFVALGSQNIALWNERYAGRLPRWGTARLVQGDSRRLVEVVREAMAVVSSPPYAAARIQQDGSNNAENMRRSNDNNRYGSNPSNLGNLREGSHAAVISSPPYAESLKPETDEQTARKQARIARSKTLYDGRRIETPSPGKAALGGGYGTTEGNLGAMQSGDVNAVITSPPFVESLASDDPQKRGGMFKTDPRRRKDKTLTATYGESVGQLGQMKGEGFEAAIASPPHECALVQTYEAFGKRPIGKSGAMPTESGYGYGEGRLGRDRTEDTVETFWSASRLILEQCFAVLSPGAHACFVVKDFVRNKRVVPFCEQWTQLCEAVGFKLVHIHRAWLIENHGEQHRLDGGVDELKIERISFFRRLAQKKGSPRIDYEVVVCFERP